MVPGLWNEVVLLWTAKDGTIQNLKIKKSPALKDALSFSGKNLTRRFR